jgi:hypothetical protein
MCAWFDAYDSQDFFYEGNSTAQLFPGIIAKRVPQSLTVLSVAACFSAQLRHLGRAFCVDTI